MKHTVEIKETDISLSEPWIGTIIEEDAEGYKSVVGVFLGDSEKEVKELTDEWLKGLGVK